MDVPPCILLTDPAAQLLYSSLDTLKVIADHWDSIPLVETLAEGGLVGQMICLLIDGAVRARTVYYDVVDTPSAGLRRNQSRALPTGPVHGIDHLQHIGWDILESRLDNRLWHTVISGCDSSCNGGFSIGITSHVYRKADHLLVAVPGQEGNQSILDCGFGTYDSFVGCLVIDVLGRTGMEHLRTHLVVRT